MRSFYEMNWIDRRNILLLLTLYTLQGIPMGLSGSIPIILRENGLTYEYISIFSLVSLPFSLKLLWAPLVDSLYIPSIGRRKSWLIPVQSLSGLILIYGSFHITNWIEVHPANASSNIYCLTYYFLILYFMMATQDIAVDGWALTLLSKENVAYGTVCNSIGQTFGYIIANQGFLILSDHNWCRDFLGLSSPLVDLASFMFFWGLLFLFLTVVLFFASEAPPHNIPTFSFSSISRTYGAIYEICQLGTVQRLMIILFTSKISIAPCDAVSIFKLQEYGMPRSDIVLLSPLLLIVSFSLPVLLGPMLARRPLDIFWKGLLLKLCSTTLVWILFELLASSSILIDETRTNHYPPFPLYVFTFAAVMIFNEFASNLIFNSQMAFFSKIADPSIGGTYMTLLNTVANLGSKWPNFLSLYLLPSSSTSYCHYDDTVIEYQIRNALEKVNSWLPFFGGCQKSLCHNLDGKCEILYDGYTIQQHCAAIFGVIWLILFVRILKALENAHQGEWMIHKVNPHPVIVSSNKEV